MSLYENWNALDHIKKLIEEKEKKDGKAPNCPDCGRPMYWRHSDFTEPYAYCSWCNGN